MEASDSSPALDTSDATLVDARVARPRPDVLLAPGSSVGNYRVVRAIGSGGMGTVYAAYERKTGARVALKVLRSLGSDHRDARRMRREARALARLSHPNVVTILDAGAVDDRLYVATELVDGKTLARWLEPQRDSATVLEVVLDAGRGLAAAHSAGLVHGDFTPNNVMIDHQGRVLVLDFGQAQAITPCDEVSAQGLGSSSMLVHGPRGTLGYMSPEQLAGLRVDPRSDQFAFCATFYEALFGQRPFAGETPAEIAASVTLGRLRPIEHSNVPVWIQDTILRGLSPEPEHRWPSMDALLEALSGVHHRRRWWGWAAAMAVGFVAGLWVMFA